MAYQLSTTKSGISKNWIDQKFLMIGHSGVGKSTFWQYADDVAYIQSEAGLNYIDAMKNPVHSWEDVCGLMAELFKAKREGKFPYKTLIVDTIDRIVEFAGESVMAWAKVKYKNGADFCGIGDVPEGAGWARREDFVNKFLKGLEEFPCAKVIIGHLENKEIKDDGGKYNKGTISIGGKVGGNILAWSDHTLNVVGKMQGDATKRMVFTRPTQSREAKSRGSMVPDGWIWSSNDEENFKKLRSFFN